MLFSYIFSIIAASLCIVNGAPVDVTNTHIDQAAPVDVTNLTPVPDINVSILEPESPESQNINAAQILLDLAKDAKARGYVKSNDPPKIVGFFTCGYYSTSIVNKANENVPTETLLNTLSETWKEKLEDYFHDYDKESTTPLVTLRERGHHGDREVYCTYGVTSAWIPFPLVPENRLKREESKNELQDR
eukprot:Pgem_evm1s3113